jgi:hypothetical protein
MGHGTCPHGLWVYVFEKTQNEIVSWKEKIGLTFITVNINITVYDVFLSFFT